MSQALVAPAYNPSDLGGRDQEGWGSEKLARPASQPIAGCGGSVLLFPSYAGGWDTEDCMQFQASKKVCETHLNGRKLGVVEHCCHTRDRWKCKIRGFPSRPANTPLRNNQSKKGWTRGWSKESACLASVKSWVQTPIPPHTQKESTNINFKTNDINTF
jgi:hypothetical protein